jgi:hypothetical protein
MAQLIYRDCSLTVNSVDLSAYVKSLTVNYGANMQDDTVMGDSTRSFAGGLLEWSVNVEFVQDYAATRVDATLFSLVGAAGFTIVIKPVSSSANPTLTGTAVIATYNPQAGTVGDLLKATCTFQSAGTLTRTTT